MSMLKKWKTGGLAVVLVIMSSLAASAQEGAALPVESLQDPPFTVSGVVVDKTDKNAVVARDAAIVEVRRAAMRKLAERNLDPSEMAAFKLPDDSLLTTLVQDFEITNEQLSATRYVGTFTVRFNPAVESYIKVRHFSGLQPAVAQSRQILVLPYLETDADTRLLWEDGNDWLAAWQSATLQVPEGWTVAVPLGDIEDVASGSSDDVWSGGYDLPEKMRVRYGASEVALAVAMPLGGGGLAIDLYTYKSGRLAKILSLTPVVPTDNPQMAYRQAVAEVIMALQEPVPQLLEPLVPDVSAGVAGPLEIEAEMSFENPARWLEMQKRLSHMTPPAQVALKALSSNSARFTIAFDGTLETLQFLVSSQGVNLGIGAVEVGAPGSVAPSQKPLYALQFTE